jgi:hypothetical protein
MTYVVGVVLLQQPTPALVYILVALAAAAHAQSRIHVHVVTGQIQRDEALEDDAEARESLRQEDEQTRCCTPVCDHVQHRTKLGALFVCSRCVSIERVEKAGYAVEEGACAWMEGHVVERDQGEEDARVTCVFVNSCSAIWKGRAYRSSLE